MKDMPWCFLLWLALAAPVLGELQPNIVFILTDDQGFDDVSWQNKGVVTPNLQQLLDAGVRLQHNYVQPVCTPTRSALMTGYYPYHLGRQRGPLGLDIPTGLTMSQTLLPEKLSKLGYTTHLVGKWHLGFCDWAYTPTRRGFDTFYGFYQGVGDYFTHTEEGGFDFRDNERVAWEVNGTYSTYLFGDRAVEIIEEEASKTKPFFLYLAQQNVHVPIEVPDEYLEYYPDDPNQVYYGMVTAMDDVVGRVVEALRTTGQENNTLIIFSSDNGSPNEDMNKPLRGTKYTFWEGGTRVPGLVYSPLLENTPRDYSGLIHITDWHNTLLAVAGAETLPENDGFNQWEALRTGEAPSPRDSLIYNLDENDHNATRGAIRVGKYKFFLGAELDADPQDWLIDLEEDPNETTNLVEIHPDVAAELQELLFAQLESLVPADEPDHAETGDPDNWGGVWEPGWCTAH